MTEDEMKRRVKAFALRAARLASSFPHTRLGNMVGGQLVRCGPSVASNYRAACRGRSRAEFAAKLGIAEEEADETQFWIEFAIESGMVKDGLVRDLLRETEEILAILVSSRKTARRPMA
jgi:four helix bundle protein